MSNDVQQVILHMHGTLRLSVREIVYLTDVPKRTVYRILTTQTEKKQPQHQNIELRGRPRKLDFADTQVRLSTGSVSGTPTN